MRKPRRKRSSWKDASKEKAGVELINGRAMMVVSLLYTGLASSKEESGMNHLQKYLRDYKDHQQAVHTSIASAYEVLAEGKESRGGLDLEVAKQLKKLVSDEMEYIWDKKARPAAPKLAIAKEVDFDDEYSDEPEEKEEPEVENTEGYEPPPKEESTQDAEDDNDDWSDRFSEGEFDLE